MHGCSHETDVLESTSQNPKYVDKRDKSLFSDEAKVFLVFVLISLGIKFYLEYLPKGNLGGKNENFNTFESIFYFGECLLLFYLLQVSRDSLR